MAESPIANHKEYMEEVLFYSTEKQDEPSSIKY